MSVHSKGAGLFLVPPPGVEKPARPQYGPGSVVLMALNQFEDADFLRVLDEARPGLILELRMAPRFDIGALDRRKAFDLFEAHDSKYFDISAAAMDHEGEARIDAMVRALTEVLDKTVEPARRPMLVLTDPPHLAARLNGIIAVALATFGADKPVTLSPC